MANRFVVLGALIAAGCGSDPVGVPASTNDETETDTGSGNGTTSDIEPGSTTGSSSASDSSSESGSDSSDTGEDEVEAVELLVRGRVGGALGFYRARLVDGVAEGPTPLVEPGIEPWTFAELMPERRVVFASDVGVFLGSLDGEPADVVPLNMPSPEIEEVSRPLPVPGEDAVIFVDETAHIAYRVDFPGGVPSEPVVVADGVIPPYVTFYTHDVDIDPLARYVMLNRDVGTLNVALARLDPPDPADLIPLTDLVAPESARSRGFMADGSGVLWTTYEEGVSGNDARALWYAALDGDDVGPPQVVQTLDESQNSIAFVVPHPFGLGVVARAYHDSSVAGQDLFYYPIEDGIVQPAMTLMSGVVGGNTPTWSPDGNWLTFTTVDASVEIGERFLVPFEDGQPLRRVTVTPFDVAFDGLAASLFSDDSQWMYFEHNDGDEREIKRVHLSASGADDVEVIVPDKPDDYPDLQDLSSDGNTLLYLGHDDGVPAILARDVSGPEPGEPVRMSRTPVGMTAFVWAARFSPHDQYVVYQEPVDLFAEERLLIVDVDHPGEALEVLSDSGSWQFVPPE